jgi:hypothetical protein
MLHKPASLAVASLVVLCAMAAPQVAQATVAGASGASAACKAASGPGASVFYFDTTGALNTSTGIQYLTCNIPDVDGQGGVGTDIQELDLRYGNTTGASVNITCVFQAINAGVASNALYTLTAPANTSDNHLYIFPGATPALPLRGDLGFYTMSCAIPAGASLNMIKAYYPGTIGA